MSQATEPGQSHQSPGATLTAETAYVTDGEGGAGAAIIKPDYDPRLANEDLAPLKDQNRSWYNIFAFWMSDVHSVGGYITAGSLFALGLTSWQVFVCLTIVLFFCNLVAKPSQRTGVPYPVICRSVFGVLGANIPAIIRGSSRWPGTASRPTSPRPPSTSCSCACGRPSRPTPTSPNTASSG